MKKQILFRADGGTNVKTVNILPRNLVALNFVNKLVYDNWNRADKGTTFNYAGRQCFKTTFRAVLSMTDAKTVFDMLQNTLGGNVVKGYDRTNNRIHIYSSTDASFIEVRSMVEAMQKLYSQVANLPESTSEDRYKETYGQIVTVDVPNTYIKLVYTVPFDMAAWEERHKTTAQVVTSDAAAKQKQAEANMAEAEAKKETSKAKLMKVGTIAAIVAVLAFVVFLIVKIVKK